MHQFYIDHPELVPSGSDENFVAHTSAGPNQRPLQSEDFEHLATIYNVQLTLWLHIANSPDIPVPTSNTSEEPLVVTIPPLVPPSHSEVDDAQHVGSPAPTLIQDSNAEDNNQSILVRSGRNYGRFHIGKLS